MARAIAHRVRGGDGRIGCRTQTLWAATQISNHPIPRPSLCRVLLRRSTFRATRAPTRVTRTCEIHRTASKEHTFMNWFTGGRALTLGASVALSVLSGGVMPSPASAEPGDGPAITQAVFFGDSLTDTGTYGFRFTTMPGKTWAQHLAERLGQPAEPNEHVAAYSDVYQGKPGIPGPGGLNYAEGG